MQGRDSFSLNINTYWQLRGHSTHIPPLAPPFRSCPHWHSQILLHLFLYHWWHSLLCWRPFAPHSLLAVLSYLLHSKVVSDGLANFISDSSF